MLGFGYTVQCTVEPMAKDCLSTGEQLHSQFSSVAQCVYSRCNWCQKQRNFGQVIWAKLTWHTIAANLPLWQSVYSMQ